MSAGTSPSARIVYSIARLGVALVALPFSFAQAQTSAVTPDTTPPLISAVTASSVTASGATITWTTDEASDSQVDYGPTADYGSSSALNTTLVTTHTVTLTGLTGTTLYHVRVRSRDAAGNLALSGQLNASSYSVAWNTTTASNSTHTLTAVARDTSGNVATSNNVSVIVNNFDATAPRISNLNVAAVSLCGAEISWITDEASDTQVEYGLTVEVRATTAVCPCLQRVKTALASPELVGSLPT